MHQLPLYLCRQFHAADPDECHYQLHFGDCPLAELTQSGSIIYRFACMLLPSADFETAFPNLTLPPGSGPILVIPTLTAAPTGKAPSFPDGVSLPNAPTAP